MHPIRKSLTVAILVGLTACSSGAPSVLKPTGPVLSSSNAVTEGMSVEVRIETGTQLKTQAARKTIADINHYYVKLVNTATGIVVADGTTTNLTNFFHKVPNGTYKVVVDALDANGNSVVQGGAQDSSNTVIVAAPDVTYSDGDSCLKVRLKLLNATGEGVGSRIIVEDGDEWTGTPQMSPGGNCPTCPSPVPSSPTLPFGISMEPYNLYSVVGNGTAASPTDGQDIHSACLREPEGLCLDKNGNLVPGLFITGMIGVASCGSDEFLGSPWLANPVNCRPATEQGER
jgi:hypothetical protein